MDVNSGILWQCPPVIKNIFQHLCARDLSSCAKVCSFWHSMSITEINRRRFPVWFLENRIGQTMDMDCKLVPDYLPPGALYPFQQKLAAMRPHPTFCLVFLTGTMLEDIEEVFPSIAHIGFSSSSSKKKRKKYVERRVYLEAIKDNIFKPLLPIQCQPYCIVSPGIIGCHDNLSPTEVENGRAITGFLLPHFPNVSVHHYSLNQFIQSESSCIPSQPIKCVLMFVTPPFSLGLVQRFIDRCSEHNGDSEFAIGGAIVESVCDGFSSCFVFTGDNIEAASVVMDETTEDVSYELALFKKTGLLENQCFAFMFCCIDKGIRKYRAPNFESSIFRNMYPDVPLTGVFGNGEIGTHFLPNVDKEDPDNMARHRKFSGERSIRAYNSIFVLLSVKTPK